MSGRPPSDAIWRKIDDRQERFFDTTSHTSFVVEAWGAFWTRDGKRYGFWEWRKI